MVSRVIPVDPFDLVIFGGTGDLARRKILPGLYRRFADGQIPAEVQIIGAARSELTAEDFRKMVAEAFEEFLPAAALDKKTVAAFLGRIDYVAIDARGEDWGEPTSVLAEGPGLSTSFFWHGQSRPLYRAGEAAVPENVRSLERRERAVRLAQWTAAGIRSTV